MHDDDASGRPNALRRGLVLAPVALATASGLALLGGCGGGSGDFDGDDDDNHQDEPRLRFVNATQDYPSLAISLHGESRPVIEALAFGGATTGYDWVSSGRHSVTMKSAQPRGEITGSERFSERTYSTALAYGPQGDNARLLFIAENEAAASNETRIRALHVSPPDGPLDLYLTHPDLTLLSNERPALTELQYSQLSGFHTRNAGRVALHLTAARSKTPLFRVTFAPPAGSVITLVLLQRDRRLNVTALPQRQAGHPLDNQLP